MVPVIRLQTRCEPGSAETARAILPALLNTRIIQPPPLKGSAVGDPLKTVFPLITKQTRPLAVTWMAPSNFQATIHHGPIPISKSISSLTKTTEHHDRPF